MTRSVRAGAVAAVALLAWAAVLIWPGRSASGPMGPAPAHGPAGRPSPSLAATGTSSRVGPEQVARSVVVAVDTLDWRHPMGNPRTWVGLVAPRARPSLIGRAPRLTAAELQGHVHQSARILDSWVESEGSARVRARVWVLAAVTITTPGRPVTTVPAPEVVDVEAEPRGWFVWDLEPG